MELIPKNLWKKTNEPIFIIDTPGLDDNRGVEIDIKNVLGTTTLIQNFK